MRGGCTPGNSRLWVLVPSGDRPGPTEPAGETLASLVLIKALAHVRGDGYLPGKHAAWPRRTIRGGCTPGNSRRVTAQDNSRLWVLVPSGDRPGPTEPAGETLASLVLIEPLAHVRADGYLPGKHAAWPRRTIRGGCTPGKSRLGAVSCAHACANRWRTCAAQCLGCQFAPMGGKLRLRLCKRAAHVRGGGIFRAKYGSEPGGQFQGRGAAGGIKQKEKRPWQTPLAFSL